MPAKTEKQRKFFGVELGRKRKGKKTRTGLSEKKLREFATKGSAPFTNAEVTQGYRKL